MLDDRTERDSVAECALHPNRERGAASVYEGLSEEDRIAPARMITDGACASRRGAIAAAGGALTFLLP